MSTSKKIATLLVGLLTATAGLELPPNVAPIVAALLAAAAYVANHDDLFGAKKA